jgi:hypothetical protein
MDENDIFEGKSLSDVFKEHHDVVLDKRKKIESIITQLVGFITSSDEARMIAPLVKDFYDVGIKNDEQMVKIATIAQRAIASEQNANSSDDGGILLSEVEKDRLMANALSDVEQTRKEVDIHIKALTNETESNN